MPFRFRQMKRNGMDCRSLSPDLIRRIKPGNDEDKRGELVLLPAASSC
jgi:hypothetical protein